MTVLRATNLRKSFGGEKVLDGIDLELRQGEVVLLRGENGSGKTTLLNILTGNLEPDAGEIHYASDNTPRTYRFPRRWFQNLNPWDHFRPEFVAKEGLSRTWQDVRLFGAMSLRDNISVAEPKHPGENPIMALLAPGKSKKREEQIDHKADAILNQFGLRGREESSGDMISLGQSKRVAIARTVAAGANVLFLDEPLAGLDRQGVNDVLTLLESLVKNRDLTLVIVEHVFNQKYLERLATTDWLLKKGEIRRSDVRRQKHISVQDSQNDHLHSESPSKLAQESTSRPAWFELLSGEKAEIIDESLPRGAGLTRIRRPDRWRPDAEPVLEISDLVVKRGRRTVIGLDEERNESGFDLTLHEGEIAILQAPNGWGKSTLFSAICGQLLATGHIELQGREISQLRPWERARGGLVSLPSDEFAFPSLSVEDTIRLSRSFTNLSDSDIRFNRRRMSSLSGGERQRMFLRIATHHEAAPIMALYDEPFAMLDAQATAVAIDQVLSATRDGALLCLVPSSSISNSSERTQI